LNIWGIYKLKFIAFERNKCNLLYTNIDKLITLNYKRIIQSRKAKKVGKSWIFVKLV